MTILTVILMYMNSISHPLRDQSREYKKILESNQNTWFVDLGRMSLG